MAGRGVPRLPHGGPSGLLYARGPLGSRQGEVLQSRTDGRTVLRDRKAPGRGPGGVPPHGPLHSQQQAQLNLLDGRKVRRRELRAADPVSLPEGYVLQRTASSREHDRPERTHE